MANSDHVRHFFDLKRFSNDTWDPSLLFTFIAALGSHLILYQVHSLSSIMLRILTNNNPTLIGHHQEGQKATLWRLVLLSFSCLFFVLLSFICIVEFAIPKLTEVDYKLILGAFVFGLGWAIGGFCPGKIADNSNQYY